MKVLFVRILASMAFLASMWALSMPVQAADVQQSYDFCATFQPKSAADHKVWQQNCGGEVVPVGNYCETHKFPGLFGSKEAWRLWKENGCTYTPPAPPPSDHPSTNNPPPDDEYTPPEEEEDCPDDQWEHEDDESDWGDEEDEESDWGDESDWGHEDEESDWGDE